MKRLRATRSLSVACRSGAALCAVGAVLAAAAPAQARHHPPRPAAAPTAVNFRSGALFTCFGASGGLANGNTATISSPNFFTVTAVVTVSAPPGTVISGQLTQGGCARLKFFTFAVPATGTRTFTVSDVRVSNTAFVWIVGGVAGLQITPGVTL
jgi:hypothetical protein